MTAKKWEELTKEEKICEQIKIFNRQLKSVDTKKKKLVASLVERAAYYTVSMQELEEMIDREGYIIEDEVTYKNGQTATIRTQNSNVRTHIAMTKNLIAIIRQLTDLSPEVEIKMPETRLEKFKAGKL